MIGTACGGSSLRQRQAPKRRRRAFGKKENASFPASGPSCAVLLVRLPGDFDRIRRRTPALGRTVDHDIWRPWSLDRLGCDPGRSHCGVGHSNPSPTSGAGISGRSRDRCRRRCRLSGWWAVGPEFLTEISAQSRFWRPRASAGQFGPPPAGPCHVLAGKPDVRKTGLAAYSRDSDAAQSNNPLKRVTEFERRQAVRRNIIPGRTGAVGGMPSYRRWCTRR